MSKQFDILAIGDITTDAFIRIKDAHVTCNIDKETCELCMRFGDKIPYEFVEIVKAVGNSANAAVSAARLGLSTGLVSHIGKDQNGNDMLEALKENNVSTEFIKIHEGLQSNYHYVLWYDVERTILVKHHEYPYSLPAFKPPRFIYLSSMGEKSLPYHAIIADFVKHHPETKLVFQPGTFQIKLGKDALKDIYANTELFFSNVEEAKIILGTSEEKISVLMTSIAGLGPNHVILTDGIKGAYAFDGKNSWFIPIYPQEPYERTGAGDAFASTIVSALALGKSFTEALLWAPINSASVVKYVGAQKGLLTREILEERLKSAPKDYVIRKLET